MASSYARTQVLNGQVSVMAQAKPAIILAQNNGYSSLSPADELSERIQSSLKLSPKCKDSTHGGVSFDHKMKLVEDDSTMQRQNASNQMRQAAVMAAVASQQKVRLSATERLAMTAKRPVMMTNQHSRSQSQLSSRPTSQINGSNPSMLNKTQQPHQSLSSTKSAPMPTLETLLAVQRQLQKHTRQNLNSVPQELVNKQSQQAAGNLTAPPTDNQQTAKLPDNAPTFAHVPQQQQSITTNGCTNNGGGQLQRAHKPLPPPPQPDSTLQQRALQQQRQHQSLMSNTVVETYEKDLPPLPASISPSTSTDGSQMNSLESHQSSPATSLVSLPPPPPPISSYLQHFDDAASNHTYNQSNSSTPSTIVSSSDMSSVRYFPSVPIKMTNLQQHQQQSFGDQSLAQTPDDPSPDEPAVATKPTNQKFANIAHQQVSAERSHVMQYQREQRGPNVFDEAPKIHQAQPNQHTQQQQNQHHMTHPNAPSANNTNRLSSPAPVKRLPQNNMPAVSMTHDSQASSRHQQNPTQTQSEFLRLNSYQLHAFSTQSSQSYDSHRVRPSSLLPPPPPPPLSASTNLQAARQIPSSEVTGGFDQPDSGSFRFPTPPPPEMLLDDDDEDEGDEDDDFHCKIPTPPGHESMSAATFQDFHCQPQANQSLQTSSASIFNSSTFTASSTAIPKGIQPPVLFRQQSKPQHPAINWQQSQSIKPQQNPPMPTATTNPSPTVATMPPQLTVHINNEDGLLSTTTNPSLNHLHQHHRNHHHGQHPSVVNHHIMMTIAASSSSPSSSSDGDGQSNSSSSTSGIHSSIDSPSSSNSKLDDFNYSVAKMKLAHEQAFKNLTSSLLTASGVTNGVTSTPLPAPQTNSVNVANKTNAGMMKPRPALKQKKSVSFSDKVELVACADEQSEDHLPNPLLARVLAGKMQ